MLLSLHVSVGVDQSNLTHWLISTQAMMRKSNWRTLQPGEALVRAGESMDRIVLVATGSVDSYETAPDGSLKRLYRYRAKRDIARPQDSTVNSFQVPIRGCVIGGTALLDPSVRAQPYPSTAPSCRAGARRRVFVRRFTECDGRESRDRGGHTERVVLRPRRRFEDDGASTTTPPRRPPGRLRGSGSLRGNSLTIMQEDVRVTMYELIMRVALADGVVHSAEREFLAKYQMENAITDAEPCCFPGSERLDGGPVGRGRARRATRGRHGGDQVRHPRPIDAGPPGSSIACADEGPTIYVATRRAPPRAAPRPPSVLDRSIL